ARIEFMEIGKTRQQPPGRKSADDADRHHAAILMAFGKLIEGGTNPSERLGDHRDEGLSLIRQHQTARQPEKQPGAEKVLEGFHLVTDGRLSDAQFHAGLGEACRPRRGFGRPESVERKMGCHRRRPYIFWELSQKTLICRILDVVRSVPASRLTAYGKVRKGRGLHVDPRRKSVVETKDADGCSGRDGIARLRQPRRRGGDGGAAGTGGRGLGRGGWGGGRAG